MKKVFKYHGPSDCGVFNINLPSDYHILKLALQNNLPMIYIQINDDLPLTKTVQFTTYPTGGNLPENPVHI